MNIFILSWIIDQCAQYHCDKHIVKMILETTQLLSTCYHVVDPVLANKYLDDGLIYRKTHMNHPSSIWTRECKENFVWLCHLGLALCKEKAYRYDTKPEDHKCYSKLMFLITHVPPSLPSNNGRITMPKLAMPEQYKNPNDPISSYRLYYINDKQRMLVWRKRTPPPFIPQPLQRIHYQSERDRYNKMLEKLESRKRPTQQHLDDIIKLKQKVSEFDKHLSSFKK